MRLFLGTLLATVLFAQAARAEGEATIAGTTLKVPGAAPITLPFSGGTARTTSVAIGEGKHVLHVQVTEGKDKRVFEVIASGTTVVFAGITGYASGEDGERTGQVVQITDRDDATKFVLVADVREDTRICGQAVTPLTVRGLDPHTMQLRGASLHRIPKSERDAATKLVATASTAKPPLARLLVASGGSNALSPALTDGRLDSAWNEERPGDGHGELVAMRAEAITPLHSVLITPVPTSAPDPARVSPRTFFLATDARLFQVTMPEDAKPGVSYEIPFPEPIRTGCLTLVLDEAYDHDLAAPVVTVAELAVRTKFDVDGATFEDVAKELSGARADEAAAILRRGGDAALAAVSARWSSLDGKGRAFAVDVAASAGTCDGPAMQLLTRALADKEREVRSRASGRIERCGKKATASLAAAVRSSEEPRRAASAGLLASIAPAAAFDPLNEQLGMGAPATRRALRAALGRATTSREKLVAALTQPNRTADARLDLVRALGPKLGEVRAEAETAITGVLADSPDMRTRWLLVEPLAQLGDTAHLGALLGDPEWTVRARAVEVGAALPALAPSIAKAASDPEPRVREAAFRAHAPGAPQALATDPWTFVRVAAAEALGATKANNEALAKALKDPSAKVRAAAVNALGNAGATTQATAIRERLDDTKEDTEVRALAARTLGKLCVQNAADRLTRLALLAKSPVDEADERIGMAALEALGALHPPDIEKRLAPLRDPKSKTLLKRVADAAVTEPGSCR